jgi:hypothetical protein
VWAGAGRECRRIAAQAIIDLQSQLEITFSWLKASGSELGPDENGCDGANCDGHSLWIRRRRRRIAPKRRHDRRRAVRVSQLRSARGECAQVSPTQSQTVWRGRLAPMGCFLHSRTLGGLVFHASSCLGIARGGKWQRPFGGPSDCGTGSRRQACVLRIHHAEIHSHTESILCTLQ